MSDISRLLYITGQNNMQNADYIQNADYRLGVKERYLVILVLEHWLGMGSHSNWRGVWNKALSDFWCNVKFSSSFTTECKEIWKENLVIYQKSLKAFLQAPLQLIIKANHFKSWFARRGKNWSIRRKSSQCRVENEETQPTCDTGIEPQVRWWEAIIIILSTMPSLCLQKHRRGS